MSARAVRETRDESRDAAQPESVVMFIVRGAVTLPGAMRYRCAFGQVIQVEMSGPHAEWARALVERQTLAPYLRRSGAERWCDDCDPRRLFSRTRDYALHHVSHLPRGEHSMNQPGGPASGDGASFASTWSKVSRR